MSRPLESRSALLLVVHHLYRSEQEEPLLPSHGQLPASNLFLSIRRGTSPRKQRKGKSGEIARKGGK